VLKLLKEKKKKGQKSASPLYSTKMSVICYNIDSLALLPNSFSWWQ